jgi:hypothetical protein
MTISSVCALKLKQAYKNSAKRMRISDCTVNTKQKQNGGAK